MSTTKPNPKPRVVDNAAVGELYANKVISTSFDGGALILTIGVTRIIPDRIDDVPNPANMPTPRVHVSGRIALSPAAAVEAINGLTGLLHMAQAAQAQAAQAQALANSPSANKIAS
jgi:hypothetical protein